MLERASLVSCIDLDPAGKPRLERRMTVFAANPFMYVLALLLILGGGYYGWGMLDHVGLAEERMEATVTGKQYNLPGVTYNTNIVAGRAYTQAHQTGETYVLSLTIGQEPTVALASKEQYDRLKAGDTVQVMARRTRFTKQLEVTEVMP
jgi:hypothetical protein